ncbi:hypothetical protein ACGFX8_35975 [Streptomyces sp. NPDC048362]
MATRRHTVALASVDELHPPIARLAEAIERDLIVSSAAEAIAMLRS